MNVCVCLPNTTISESPITLKITLIMNGKKIRKTSGNDCAQKIILEVRKHWFVFWAQSLPLVFLIFFPFIIKVILSVMGLSDIVVSGKHTQTFITVITTTWIWFIWVAFFILWTDYYLDILILTNRRIIDIEQKGFFSREI